MSKIARMQQAVETFIDVASCQGVDELTVVSFSATASTTVSRIPLTEIEANVARNAVSALIPGGMTSIGAGLQLGLTELSGTEIAYKEIILLTDGIENTPPMIDEIELNQNLLRVFTIGLGLPEFINVEKLQNLSNVSGGYFQVTDGNDDLLPKFFIQILSDVSTHQIVLDPKVEVSSREEIDVPVYLSDSDFNATFILNWEHHDSFFEIDLINPDGKIVKESEFCHLTNGVRYRNFQIPLRGTRWNTPGKWLARIRLIKASVRYETAFLNVAVASENQFEWKIIPNLKRSKRESKPDGGNAGYTPQSFPKCRRPPICPIDGLQKGDSVHLLVRITEPAIGSKIVGGSVFVREPKESFVQLKQKFQKIDLDRLNKNRVPKRREPSSKILESKLKIAKSGLEAGIVFPFEGNDGFYHFFVKIEGQTRLKNKFHRERYFQLYISP